MAEIDLDTLMMKRALALAAEGVGLVSPNPLVGCVIVSEAGEVVGEGSYNYDNVDHAEVVALGQSGEKARGGTAYVTLEPHAHFGKTPPCTDAILAAGVRRVVAASADPSPVARGGADRLREAGIEVSLGVEEAAARELNASFFHALSSDRPFVQLKLALSLDGALADRSRQPGWLTGELARREVHRLRAGVDAVAVGIGTVLADDPELTVRHATPPRVPPLRVVFDTSARLPRTSKLAHTASQVPVTVVCWAPEPAHAAALEHTGVTLLHAATSRDALVALRERGVRSLLVEGGAALASALLQEALVDRLVIFRAPLVLGSGALNAFGSVPGTRVGDAPRWRLLRSQRFEDDEMSVYAPPI